MNNLIILNSENRISNSKNKLLFKFPEPVEFTSDDTIGVASFNIFNSFFNIESSRNNNKFTIVWNADTQTTYECTIEDGFYDINALNYQLQYFCIQNNLYCYDANQNKNVYFIEAVFNLQIYKIEL